MAHFNHRRDFLRHLGLGAAVAPFIMNAPSLGFANQLSRKQRLVIMFSPNGVVPDTFWPAKTGTDFELPESVKPLEHLRNRTLFLKGVSDRVRGDGDDHMRGIGCLLTGIELFPGNIQGGGATPAGWASGLSIDQEIRNYLQKQETTRTRFGSLEFGVLVPERADTWTRMVYAGPNQPLAPVSDPYQMFKRMYGELKDRENLASVLDDLQEELGVIRGRLSVADRHLLDQQESFVREFEKSLSTSTEQSQPHVVPELEPGIDAQMKNMPRLSRMQIDLLVNALENDFTRVASLQYTNSVGQARMSWLGIEEDHHGLSHEPPDNKAAQEKLTKINRWFCEELAYLATKLSETPEPGGDGSLLDNTLIVWTNELAVGHLHSHDNVPYVLVGNGLDFQMGQSLAFDQQPHNRLLMTLARGFGHELKSFGNADYCGAGPLTL